MDRLTTALLAALEACIAAAVGVAALLVPASLVWAVQFELHAPFAGFWGASAVAWLLGHGVDVPMRLDDATAVGLGLDPAHAAFPVSIALLGIGLLTAVFGRRIGVRAVRAGHPVIGAASAAIVLGVVGGMLALSASSPVAAPALVQAFLLPAIIAAGSAGVGAIGEAIRAGAPDAEPRGPIAARVAAVPSWLREGVRSAFRSGIGAAAIVLGVAALLLGVRLLVGYARMVGLYEALQTGVVGGVALTVGQLALLPNLVVWSASWLLGPGFALGSGTSISPTEHLVGPLPGVPIAALVPDGTGPGLLAVLVPVAAGAAAGWFGRRVDAGGRAPVADRGRTVLEAALRAAGAALVAAGILALLAWWSGGSIGPGRLGELGPDPIAVLAAALLLVGLPLVAGAATAAASDAGARFGWGTGTDPVVRPWTAVGAPVAAGLAADAAERSTMSPDPAATQTAPSIEAAATQPVQPAASRPTAGSDPIAGAGTAGDGAAAPEPRRPFLRGRPAMPGRRPPVDRAATAPIADGDGQETAPLDDPTPVRDAPPLRVGLTDPKPETRPVPLPPPDPDELPWWRRPPEHLDGDAER